MIADQSPQPRHTYSTTPELEIPGLKILKEIGRGGMARVYLAVQESLQRPVAVKLLNNPDTPGFHERFMNEGHYLAALSHSNIVEVHDVGVSEGNYYIVMEYLPGGDLKSKIQKGMKPSLALKVAMRIAACLDYLHGQGMVHRDLKPANILFRGDNNPIITDFGIAKLLQDMTDLTVAGSILGSPSYLSPEQAGFAGKVDGRSDLYSLGVILFEMLTGERPFKGENFAAIIMAHHKDPIPKLPEPLSHYQPIIERLLSKKVEVRYQNGAELIQAVRDSTAAKVHHLSKRLKQEKIRRPAVKQSVAQKPVWKSTKSWFITLLVVVLFISVSGFLLFDDPQLERIVQQEERVVQQPLVQSENQAKDVKQHESHIEPAVMKAIHKPAVVAVKKAPVPQQSVKSKLSKADQLFRLAYQRMGTLRLSYPKGDSAYDYFQKVLKLDPENRAAKAGIRQIVRWYIDKAEQALNENNIKQAESYINRGKIINKKHPKLIALQNRIKAPASVSKKIFDLYEKLGY